MPIRLWGTLVEEIRYAEYQSRVERERSIHDLRSIRIRLTDKGCTLRDRLSDMHRRHIGILGQTTITDSDLRGLVTASGPVEAASGARW
jgi:DNA-binding MarR family transcriptional regulator